MIMNPDIINQMSTKSSILRQAQTRTIGQWLLAPLARQIVLMPLNAQIASVAIIPGPMLRILALCNPEAPIERCSVALAPSALQTQALSVLGEPVAFPFQTPSGDWYSAFQSFDPSVPIDTARVCL